MRVQYQLVYNGAVQRAVTSHVETKEDMDRLRKEFWGSISLPWNGATVRLRRI
jgi:hypothetical protein